MVFFQRYGLLAVMAMLLLENAGVPVPGEATLLYASFVAHGQGLARLGLLALVATLACIAGDNAGYALGRRGGPRVHRWLRLTPSRRLLAQRYFQRFGPWTVALARFITGLRIVGGPAAGLFGMPWRTFLVFNALGAAVWVSCISGLGYLLAHHWAQLNGWLSRAELVLLAAATAVIGLLLLRLKRELK